ncbi:MAG: fumarylacetoacetate hydrolase family protein [Deltaproteobacteria bacterium]|nr:fumarylacetoacetate hydrolase family protein [Deltaproteobacteria bacterium]
MVTASGPRWARIDEALARYLDGPPWAGGSPTGEDAPWSEAALLAPVEPSKVVCVGRNYRAHAKELGHEVPSEPLLFLKPPSAVVGPGATVRLPPQSARVEHEGELVVVCGRRLRDVTPEEALRGLFGVTCGDDVTARDLQRKDVQFTRGKGFDTFCPLGPWVREGMVDRDAELTVTVNGVRRQRGWVRDMVFPVGELVAYISAVMTLEPGDVVFTGTPEGVGPLLDGDRVTVEISGIGALHHGVAPRRSP